MGELFEQRKQNFVDAISFKEPNKIPVGIQMSNYAFDYAGVRYQDIIHDSDKVVESFTKHLYDMEFDYVSSSISSPIDVYEAIGSNNYVFGSDGCTIIHNQTQIKFISVEDYDLLIHDYDNFINEIRPKRNGEIYHKPFGEAYEQFKHVARVALENDSVTKRINAVIAEREFIKPFSGSLTPAYMSPFNSIFDFYRGIKESLIDLRRRPELVDEACDVIMERKLRAPDFKNPKDHYEPFPMARATCHSECFLPPKQFIKYFYEPFKKYYMQFVERGGRYYMRGEGSFACNIDVMQDLPAGTMSIMLDQDDPFDTYEKYMKGKMPIGAGITAVLLKHGTVEECKDYVKKCFDTFAPGGGFFFAQNEGMISANDAKKENLEAVFNLANELSYKK